MTTPPSTTPIPPSPPPSNSSSTPPTSSGHLLNGPRTPGSLNIGSQTSPNGEGILATNAAVDLPLDLDQSVDVSDLHHDHVQAHPPLLYGSLAYGVSAVAHTARVGIRAVGAVTELALTTTRWGTSLTLALSRYLLIHALSSARVFHGIGRPTTSRAITEGPQSELPITTIQKPEHLALFHQALDHYTNITVGAVNNAFSLAELFTYGTWHLARTTVRFSIKAAEETVNIFDGIFGSTETSRAISSLISLVIEEIGELNKELGVSQSRGIIGRSVATIAMMGGLTKALTAFVCLQVITARRTRETRKAVKVYEGLVLLRTTPLSPLLLTGENSARRRPATEEEEGLLIRWHEDEEEQVQLMKDIEEMRRSRFGLEDDMGPRTAISDDANSVIDDTRSIIEETQIQEENIQVLEDALLFLDDPIANESVPAVHFEDQILSDDDEGEITAENSPVELLTSARTLEPSLQPTVRLRTLTNQKLLNRISKDFSGKNLSHFENSVLSQSKAESTYISLSGGQTASVAIQGSTIALAGPESILATPSKGVQKPKSLFGNLLSSRKSAGLIQKESTTQGSTSPTLSSSSTPLTGSLPHKRTSSNKFDILKVFGRQRKDSTPPSTATDSSLDPSSDVKEFAPTELNNAGHDSFLLTESKPSPPELLEIPSNRESTLSVDPKLPTQKTIDVEFAMSTTPDEAANPATSKGKGRLDGPTFSADRDSSKDKVTLLENLSRYCRFASAAYGREFMHLLGIGEIRDLQTEDTSIHANHYAFAIHARIPLNDVLHSSFMKSTEPTALLSNPPAPPSMTEPLIHYVCLDREVTCVVLALRGTLGLSDVLTDMRFDYAKFKGHHAHAGMLRSALHMAKPGSVVHSQVCKALQDNPGYGLVLTGHSLGAGVAALMAIEWCSWDGASVDSSDPSPLLRLTSEASGLPAGRLIHCYAFGSPCIVTSELSSLTRGLVTTLIHGDDIVATLSRGLVRDLKSVALRLLENKGLCERIISKTLGMQRGQGSSLRPGAPPDASRKTASVSSANSELSQSPIGNEEDFFWDVMVRLRESMRHERLYPSGVTYWLYHAVTVTRDSKTKTEKSMSRVSLQRCDDLHDMFGEPRFSARVISDHMPVAYEAAIDAVMCSLQSDRGSSTHSAGRNEIVVEE